MLFSAICRAWWIIAASLVVAVPLFDPQSGGFAQSPAELITVIIALGALVVGGGMWALQQIDWPHTFNLEFLNGSYPQPADAPGQHARVFPLGQTTFLIRIRVREPILMGEINLRFLNDDLTNVPVETIRITELHEEKVRAAGYDATVSPRDDGHGGITVHYLDPEWPKGGGGPDIYFTVTCVASHTWNGKLSFRGPNARKARRIVRREVSVL